jgi:hypothetical protein
MPPNNSSATSESPPAGGSATSAWSYASWAFFGLTLLACVMLAASWSAFRASAEDSRAGPILGVGMLLGMGAAWTAALCCAGVGLLFGLLGVLAPAGRTGAAWAALAFNGAFVLLSAVLLLALSP